MKISFLFGSGISQPAGYPNVNQLTEKIISNTNYFPGFKEKGDRIKDFINIIKADFNDHYSFSDRDMNYEDIYYIIDSIYQDENGNYENPLAYFYTKIFEDKYSYMLEPINHQINGRERIIDLASYTIIYIAECIEILLSKNQNSINYLNFINDINNDSLITSANIFTLNHDLVLEHFFENYNIPFSDGFNKGLVWNSIFEEKVKLFKLHGSVNWFADIIKDPYESNIHKNKKRDNSIPILLIGSFNKLHEYTRGFNFELQVLFYNYLNETNYLVISGYGFADQGINSKIFHWLYANRKNRIILIHKDINELKKTARPAIINNIDNWLATGIVKFIPKFIEEITWDEIKREINSIL